MIITDDLYGEFEVHKVLEELIASKPMQRLKGVHQGGASYLVNEKWNVTRYDHSIGVMLLIKKLGGSVEEQIAGLLHDVSHTTFSHVVDFVFDNQNEDYHEEIYSGVIMDSEIPVILSKYKYNYEEILFDHSKWTLLEQSAPELCADRVDYTLRDMYKYGYISLEEVHDFLRNLIVFEGKMYLQSIEMAEWFAKTYYKEVIDFFMEPLSIYGNQLLAKTLKISLDKNLINLPDFLGEDEEVLNILKSSKDKEVQELLKQIHPNVQVREDYTDYDIHSKNKLRLIDPSILLNNELVRASTLSEKVREMGMVAREKAERGMFIKVISS